MLPNLQNEVKNVRSIDLALPSDNLLEKGFWTLMGLAGIAWACYFIPGQIELWNESPSIITKGQADLSDVKYPGISIKMPGATHYGIAERMGNLLKYYDPPEELLQIRNIYLLCGTIHKSNEMKFGGNAYLDRDFYDMIINEKCSPFGHRYENDINIRKTCDEVRH